MARVIKVEDPAADPTKVLRVWPSADFVELQNEGETNLIANPAWAPSADTVDPRYLKFQSGAVRAMSAGEQASQDAADEAAIKAAIKANLSTVVDLPPDSILQTPEARFVRALAAVMLEWHNLDAAPENQKTPADLRAAIKAKL